MTCSVERVELRFWCLVRRVKILREGERGTRRSDEVRKGRGQREDEDVLEDLAKGHGRSCRRCDPGQGLIKIKEAAGQNGRQRRKEEGGRN